MKLTCVDAADLRYFLCWFVSKVKAAHIEALIDDTINWRLNALRT